MTAPRFFLGLQRTTASSVTPRSRRRTHPVRLTDRGELVLSFAIIVGIFLLMWLASAIAFAVTGVAG